MDEPIESPPPLNNKGGRNRKLLLLCISACALGWIIVFFFFVKPLKPAAPLPRPPRWVYDQLSKIEKQLVVESHRTVDSLSKELKLFNIEKPCTPELWKRYISSINLKSESLSFSMAEQVKDQFLSWKQPITAEEPQNPQPLSGEFLDFYQKMFVTPFLTQLANDPSKVIKQYLRFEESNFQLKAMILTPSKKLKGWLVAKRSIQEMLGDTLKKLDTPKTALEIYWELPDKTIFVYPYAHNDALKVSNLKFAPARKKFKLDGKTFVLTGYVTK